jgi:serine/threonine-protein kinase
MIEQELSAGTTVLGRYEVIACLGVGGSASVYRARDNREGGEVALKVLLAARARSPFEVQRLDREYSFGRALRYIEGITPALDHGTLPELDHRPYITFPLLDGDELDHVLTAGPLPPSLATSVLARLARLVAKVHEAGVLHRDIKPSNVMLGRDGLVSLLDFGHARRLEVHATSTSELTRAHELPGTRHYMAPEQALGGQPSPSWDIYAMGMTLYEALVGDCAYSDLSARESLQRRCKPEKQPSVLRRRPNLPPSLARFVDKCLAYDPEERPQTASAFAEALEALSAEDPNKRDAPAPQSPAEAAKRPRSGMQLGHYSIIAKLGQGGCATVYSAHDTRSDTTVALKVLSERYKGRPEREALLTQEAEALSRIGSHSNVVELLDHGRLPNLDWPYIALELIEGESVEDLIFGGATPPRRVADIAMQVALALRESHRAGVIHRDLTPSNVLLDSKGKRAVLIDFSHSAWSDSPRVPVGHPDRRTRHGEVPGSSQAMSPEQARAAPATAAMDVYAFGVLLFQLLTARAPFPEYIDRDIFIALQGRNDLDAPLLADDDFPEAPPRLIELVNACVQPNADDRPPLPSVIRTLERVLAAMAIPAPAMTEVFDVPKFSEGPPSSAAPPPAKAPSRTLPYAALGLAGLLLVIALVKLVMPTSTPASSLAPTPPPSPSQAAIVSPEPPPPLPQEAATAAKPQPAPAPPAEPLPSRPHQSPRRAAPPQDLPNPTSQAPEAAPPPQPRPPTETPNKRCQGRGNQARAATKRQDWREVLRATKKASCWTDQRERQQLRLEALRNTGKFEACVELARKVGDHRTAKFCDKQTSTP